MVRWDVGTDYDRFMGRWSRLAGARFIERLERPPGLRWLDVGCGTGALIEAILRSGSPLTVAGVDPSLGFLQVARQSVAGRAVLAVGNGDAVPFPHDTFDVVVSGLALNFMPDPLAALAEWRRVARRGGLVGAFVWDYAGRMGFLRAFWDSVVALDPESHNLDQAERFAICRPDALREAFDVAGFSSIESGDLEITTKFSDFEDFWTPFLAGQGPAPGYVASLDASRRRRLQSHLRESLPTAEDGTITLPARAWTATGTAG